MPTFIHPALLWGLGLLALPVLIHLINLLRQRRVQWAAMEFLLTSQRKNSTWVRIKELLLLALRMAAIAAVVLALAQPLLDRELGLRFGRKKTHVLALLDDSFSMSDRQADASAWDRAKRAIQRVGEDAALRNSPYTFTLLRYSQARAADVPRYDLMREPVDASFGTRLAAMLEPLVPSELALGPRQPLEAIASWVEQAGGDDMLLTLVTDFRTKDWDTPGELARLLADLNQRGVRLELVNCVELRHPNLAVAALEPVSGTRAAGVPLAMHVTVRNFGQDVVRDVTVALEEDGVARAPLRFDQVAAGESETQQFSSFFSTAGQHAIAARLPEDAVAVDNRRYAVVDVPLSVPVLIVDGGDGGEARLLATSLAPGDPVKTGIEPHIEPIGYLNNNSLDNFRAIYLLNIDRLDHVAVAAIEKYVRSGGGLAVFMGERSQAEFFDRELYRRGQGFFPLPLAGATRLLVDRLDKGPDLEPTDHPIFRVFRSGAVRPETLTVERFFAAPPGWKPADAETRVIAKLRNGSPLAVEHFFGAGRVIAFLTTAGPVWNNWARDASFVVAMLELQSYLATSPQADRVRMVGVPIDLEFDAAKFQTQAKLSPPEAVDSAARTLAGSATAQSLRFAIADPATSGIYQLQLTKIADGIETHRYAVNVDPDEGSLALLDGSQLASRLPGVKYEYQQAGQMSGSSQELAGTNLTDWVLYLLIAILVGEQALAYAASYHTGTSSALPERQA